jgi:quercetin dioxygenase-like cupin family protein
MMASQNGRDNVNLLSKPLKINELVNYQEGSIVSRTLIDKNAGTVTLFAFGQGQGLSEHKAPFDALIQIIEGTAEITLSGKKNILKEGEMIIMQANEPHALKAISNFKMLLIMVKST